MKNRNRLSLFALAAACALAASACAAPTDGTDGSTAEARAEIRVTADDVARLAEGRSFELDLPSHVYRFDPARGAIDFSRVVVDDVSLREMLVSSGVSAEDLARKPFTVGGRDAPSAGESTGGVRATAKRWCSVEVWIAPEGPDDVFRIGHVWVWRNHC